MADKSLLVAYLLWCIGGWCALHLIYLRRDKQAFVYWWSLGGYLGCGILRDFFYLPSYVKDVNNEELYFKILSQKMRKNKKPNVSITRMMGQIMVGNMWSLLVNAAVPRTDPIMGYSVQFLSILLSPLAASAGVWLIGNIGRERGSFVWAVIGSYITLLAVPVVGQGASNWCSVLSMLFFNYFSREWRRTTDKKKLKTRFTYLALGSLLMGGLFCSFLYFNATLDNKGEKIKFRDAVGNFLRSPMFQEFKTNVKKVLFDAWSNGISAAWVNFIELMDPAGFQHALKVLELQNNASQSDIKERVRSLSKLWHPDKHLGVEEKDAAQLKFIAIQEAANVLLKSKRKRSNKK